MQNQDILLPLQNAYQPFRDLILSLSESDFLSPMDDWSPRDVVAHLVGWNWQMIEASTSIMAGETPAYYADAPNDYKNINAAYVERYASRSRTELVGVLESSMQDFASFVMALPPHELDADHGVLHYRGHPATVAGIINSLKGDYEHHTRQVGEWLRGA
jgi:hypothetical protein